LIENTAIGEPQKAVLEQRENPVGVDEGLMAEAFDCLLSRYCGGDL
jgi:hypothetical protein